MADDEQVTRLLADVLHTREEGRGLVRLLCTRASNDLGMDGVATTVLSTPEHRHVVFASDDAVWSLPTTSSSPSATGRSSRRTATAVRSWCPTCSTRRWPAGTRSRSPWCARSGWRTTWSRPSCTSPSLHVLAATSEGARDLELFQLMAGEGPAFDCLSGQQPVLAPRLADVESRWPRFAPAAQEAGMTGVASVHMGTAGPASGPSRSSTPP